MLSLEKISAGAYGRKTRYQIVDIGRGRVTIATVDGLEKAGCLLRFLKGALLQPQEYKLAVETMRQVDAENGTEAGKDGKEETVSGKADNGISDGSQSD